MTCRIGDELCDHELGMKHRVLASPRKSQLVLDEAPGLNRTTEFAGESHLPHARLRTLRAAAETRRVPRGERPQEERPQEERRPRPAGGTATFDRGGHFAALEAPDLFVEDVETFFRQGLAGS
ncbi:MAG: hypothetical protein LC808_32280 [Actinobacteria bacterium]|nr:hypothetical protein [Actinomycetota bacterium]